MRNQQEIESIINGWWDGEKPREGNIQDKKGNIQDRPRDKPKERIQDTPRDRARDPIQDRPRHEVQDRIRDRSPRDRTILQDTPRFDRDNLQDSMIRRDRPRAPRHPLDDPWKRNRVKPQKYVPVIDAPFDDPLPRNDLEEIIPGIYRTPDDPVDPRNCNLWPDSPWCGGFPWSVSPVALEPKIVADECAIGLRIEPVLGFTNMPPIEIQYRKPGKCREKEEPEIPEEPTPPPINWPHGDLERPAAVVIGVRDVVVTKGFSNGRLIYDEHINLSYKSSNYEPCVYVKNGWGFDTLVPVRYLEKASVTRKLRVLFQGRWEFPAFNNHTLNDEGLATGMYRETYKQIIEILEEANRLGNYLRIKRTGENEFVYELRTLQFTIDAFYQPVCVEQPIPPPPFPPQPKPECRCMRCCNDKNDNNDDLKVMLRKLQKSVDEAHKKIGPGEFEVTIPDADPFKKGDQRLTLKFQNLSHALHEAIMTGRYDRIDNARLEAGLGLENFPAKAPAWLNALDQADIEINSMPEYLAYIVRQMDAVLGNFPIKIKIKDSDLTKEGNQEINLNIPNLAEGIAELLGLALTTRTDTDAILNAVIRTLIEVGSTKQSAILAAQYGEANAEFLGYKGEQKNTEIPFAFTPGKNRLDQILKESTQKFKGWENVDSENLPDLIAPLLELAAMWKAQNFRRVNAASAAKDILSILNGGLELAEKLKKKETGNVGDKDKEDEGNDWDEFSRNVELGWTQTSGITDTQNPYGREFDRRPIIRELGDTSDTENRE